MIFPIIKIISKSIRGKKGGYILNKKASDVKISDILIAVDERIKTIGCKKQSKQGCNGRSSKCITHDFWEELEDHINDFFTSFRHLIRGPCWAENQFKENSKIFTHTKPYQQNDWLEQFIKVSFLREMKVMGQVCSELYFDYKKNEAIQGTSKAPGNDPDKAGIFPRLRNKLSQFNKVKYLFLVFELEGGEGGGVRTLFQNMKCF